MTFPNTKIIKGWIFNKEIPDGWEDLAKSIFYNHSCGTALRIASEKDVVFRYCPLCLVKIKETNN